MALDLPNRGITRVNRDAPLSPNGRRVLTGGSGLRRDAEKGQEIGRSKGEGFTNPLTFSPNDRRAPCSGGNGEESMLKAEAGRLVRRLGGLFGATHDASPVCIAFSLDGRRALSGGSAGRTKDHSARLWDVETGHAVRRFEGHGDGVLAVAFSSDGQLGLLAGGFVRLWDLQLF